MDAWKWNGNGARITWEWTINYNIV